MNNIMEMIAEETGGKSFRTFKYSFDSIRVPSLDYDDNKEIIWKDIGETEKHKSPKDLSELAKSISKYKPLFTYFLDGSRRVFKVDDISYQNQVFPVIAGQIGIGCCKRESKEIKPFKFERCSVICLPKIANKGGWNPQLFFSNLLQKINSNMSLKKNNIEFTDILTYKYLRNEGENLENKGIAVIQDLMIDKEKEMTAFLASKNLLDQNNYLLKDGSLEYRVMSAGNFRELRKIRNNYRWVVGVSKSFNPEKCLDIKGKNNSNYIANLKLYNRTPVSKYTSKMFGDVSFAIWYVRIREKRYTSNAFDGVLKLERILVTDEEIEHGLDSEEVDFITANIINERNPVCYGKDFRWANHLYPVFLTESYVKSKYISNTLFLNIF